MAKIIDPATMPDSQIMIPGLKGPILDFGPGEDFPTSEVDDFLRMIRDTRASETTPRQD